MGVDRIDRPLLERYLADLHHELSPRRRGLQVGLLNGFFAAIRQHHWDDQLPATAVFYAEDRPRSEEKLPRALAERLGRARSRRRSGAMFPPPQCSQRIMP
jgi:hypothetical protein